MELDTRVIYEKTGDGWREELWVTVIDAPAENAKAQQELDRLEAELAALAPEAADEDLWHARRDPRQLDLLKSKRG